MLPKSLPPCPCGHSNYRSDGCHLGPERSSQWFFCGKCGRPVLTIADAGVVHLLTPTKTQAEMPQEGIDWANSKLNTHLADLQDRFRTAAEHWAKTYAWEAVCDEFGYPHGTTVGYAPFEKYEKGGPYGEYYLQDAAKKEIPGTRDRTLMDKFRDRWRELEESRPFSQAHRLPPQVPKCLYVRIGYYVRGLGENVAWSPPVSHEHTKNIPVPEDPRRRKSLEFWKGVFDELRGHGYVFSEPEEVPNRYWGDPNKTEPWYTFVHAKTRYIVGPRKRVYHISIEKGTRTPLKRQRECLGKLGKRDDVTYWVEKDNAGIHAWGRDKLIEYLTAAMEA